MATTTTRSVKCKQKLFTVLVVHAVGVPRSYHYVRVVHAVGVLRIYLQRAHAFTDCRSKQRGLAQPKVFLYILARGATNYSTTDVTKSTTERVRTNKHTKDKDVTTCNAQRNEKTTNNQQAVARYDLTCTYRGARCTRATRQHNKVALYTTK